MTRRTIYPAAAAVVALAAVAAWPRGGEPAVAVKPAAPAPSVARVAPVTAPSTASTAPSTAPTTQAIPSTTQAAAPAGSAPTPALPPALPPEFAVFQSRNPFVRGKPKAGAAAANAPEASLVLKGIADVEARMVAFVEDRNAKRVVQLAAGEPVARGTVKTINLDGIEYEAAGATRRIAVGQNLNGEVVPPTPTSKPGAAQPQPGQPGQPAPGQPMPPGGAPVPPGAPPGPRMQRGAPQAVPEG
jgi:hypothetical protein